MGFGDERGQIDQKYTEAGRLIADVMYPAMGVIPGGESARREYDADRQRMARLGAQLLRRLEHDQLIENLEQITDHYRGDGE
jgi:hypothetical protein